MENANECAGKQILSRDGSEVGTASGGMHRCQMEGCTGVRLTVRWPDGSRTYPCTKGLMPVGDHWQIV